MSLRLWRNSHPFKFPAVLRRWHSRAQVRSKSLQRATALFPGIRLVTRMQQVRLVVGKNPRCVPTYRKPLSLLFPKKSEITCALYQRHNRRVTHLAAASHRPQRMTYGFPASTSVLEAVPCIRHYSRTLMRIALRTRSVRQVRRTGGSDLLDLLTDSILSPPAAVPTPTAAMRKTPTVCRSASAPNPKGLLRNRLSLLPNKRRR